jgi:hypothetical protein
MHPSKLFFTSRVIYLFCNPTHKTEAGIANSKLGTTNSEPPGPIMMIGQSETLNSSQIIFITLFCAGAQRCCATATVATMLRQNDFPGPNRHILTSLHPIFNSAGSHTEHCWRCSKFKMLLN